MVYIAQQPHGGSPAYLVHPNADAALPHAATVVRNGLLKFIIKVAQYALRKRVL